MGKEMEIYGELANGELAFIARGEKVAMSSLGVFVDGKQVADYDHERGIFKARGIKFTAIVGEPVE